MDDCLKIENLNYKYPLGDEIFSDLSLEIKKGKFVVLLGENGSGKSTLINLLLGLRKPNSGKISIFGNDPKTNYYEIRNLMTFMSHSIEHHSHSPVRYIFECMEAIFPNYSKEKEDHYCDHFELDRDKYVYQLSLGQKARIQIISSFASNAPFILIDEITAVLDPLAREDFANSLLEEQKEGKTILMATNIPGDSKIHSDRVISVKNKKVIENVE